MGELPGVEDARGEAERIHCQVETPTNTGIAAQEPEVALSDLQEAATERERDDSR